MKQINGIWFPESDTHFADVITKDGFYQHAQFEAVLKYIQPKNRGLFIDVGAHVGLWSRMAILAGFKSILAFEPVQENYECLQENLKPYNCESYLCNVALSSEDGYCEIISEKETNSGAYHLDVGNLIRKSSFDENFYSIKDNFDLSKQVLIKIDVQGHEHKVVEGMAKFIKEYKPIIIVEQWLGGKQDLRATEYLISLGMEIKETIYKEVILGW